ncbi:tRNA pseudouridine(55) synthase TruB [Gayadomonas joobiniege]|uniref:tRNA pseudouridine(55) synthase TruB n=1 Tax=Gayadomonas joobiniege TaxID=1234606 RepID=UPI00035E1A58|nr:tRNA pseudouridine(55) synthase TruB [Gayadomonas joobiniege]
MTAKTKPVYRPLNGIFLLDKGLGASSNRVLQRVRYLFEAKKAGHTGALDPLASGLLPICFGEATKFSQFFLDADKTYQVTARLGQRTDTSDAEGELVSEKPVTQSNAEVIDALMSFVGRQKQMPSIFSALKYQGKPLYYYARKGIEVPRPVRDIQVYSIEIDTLELPDVSFTIRVSKGTYIRTIVDDLGEMLGCGAHVHRLRRSQVAGFEDMPMYPIEAIESLSMAEKEVLLLPIDAGLSHINKCLLSPEQATKFRQGQRIRVMDTASGLYRIYSEQQLLGIAELNEQGVLHPKRLLNTSDLG